MSTEQHDSTPDTLAHIKRVNTLLLQCVYKLLNRAAIHDASKLVSPEKEGYDTISVRLKGMKYGTPEYRESLRELQPVIAHHYANNDHHPEHTPQGIAGMNLLSLTEMLMDWKAATERMDQGDIRRSLEINRERFNISPQLEAILQNTIRDMGW